VKNRGFGGARIRNVTDFADRIVVPHAPRLIVFFAGSNDIHAGNTADRVVSDFRGFVERVRASLPNVAIAFVSITTSPSRFAEVETVKEANRRIREFVATDARMSFIDVFSKMVDARGAPLPELYGDDKLHLNESGYARWVEIIGPALGPPD
jgi:lysophospholipase L1-like esterase